MADPASSSFRSPLGRARGLGSAKEGTAHWWAQRVTSLALVPLTLWFVFSVVSLAGTDHATVIAWLSQPLPAIATILFLVATLWHAALGCQVILEDYVASKGLRLALITLINLLCAALTVAGVFAVLRIAL